MSNILSVILAVFGAFMTLISLVIGGFTFYFNRKKDTGSEGEWRGELKADLEHIKSGVDDLKDDNKNIKSSIQDLTNKYHELDKKVGAIDNQNNVIDRIEKVMRKEKIDG